MSLPQISGLELQELVGHGSCGAVYRAVAVEGGTPCAVKVFSSMSINRKLLSIAMRGLQNMPEHPGLLSVSAFDFENSPYFCAMPLVGFQTQDGSGRTTWATPTLESCCGKVPPDEAWRYIYEVCDAMAWLHKHNLVHCNLKPRNILLEDDQASATKITDPVQGWIGGVHHFDTTDHFMYVAPEQAEHPDQLANYGTQWDVYSFGIVAYRLLTGAFPRAEEVYAHELQTQSGARGQFHSMDNQSILAAVRRQPEIAWIGNPTSKWDARRKEIVERCLNLDPKLRWPDLREVMREFEKLEADYLLEDAREKIEQEKRRQARRVVMLRTAAIMLGTAFICASIYGIAYGWATLHRAKNAEHIIATKDSLHEVEVQVREGTISDLTEDLKLAIEEKRQADANLQLSQEAVDQFLTLLLQMPTGLGLQADISEKQINDALTFYEKERERFKDNDDLLPERARNCFNTAQLLMRKQKRVEARDFFEQAKSTLEKLMVKQPAHADLARRQALLGRTCRWLGTLKAEDGHRADATALFKQAVASLAPALEADKENRSTRYETAAAWYELGKRARRDGLTQQSIESLAKSSGLMDAKTLGDTADLQEQFLYARSQIEQALSLRDQGRVDDAMKSLFDSMEVMVKLVEKARPNNQEHALALAEAYLEFGEIVAGKLGTTDAKDAQTEAQAILMELVRVHPQWADARCLLARNYGDLAGLERDLGNGSEALRKQDMAVKTLVELSKDNPDNSRFLSELARQQGQHAQLLCDLGKPRDAIPMAQEAVSKLESLIKKNENSLDELDRKSCGVLVAQLYGILGHSGEISKNSQLAKTSFIKASEQWEALKARHGEDEVISQGLVWTKGRLQKFK
jgi:eukaryotic-like serine/threonine-protein kinase